MDPHSKHPSALKLWKKFKLYIVLQIHIQSQTVAIKWHFGFKMLEAAMLPMYLRY